MSVRSDRLTSHTISSSRPTGLARRPGLIVVSGSTAGRCIELGEREVSIGRSEECTVCIPHGSVSRRHAAVTRALGRSMVLDLKSTNGTFVNERKIEHLELKNCDLIRVGKMVLKYLDNEFELEYMRHVLSAAMTDSLTGLFNRAHFDEILPIEVARGASASCCLIVFDIDHFKAVNDRFGHPAGDAVLRHAADVVKSQLFRGEVPFRVGGEEFALILPGVHYALARDTAELLRAAVERTVYRDPAGTPIPITLSLGVAELERGEDAVRLYQRADVKLYRAKNSGRNRVS
jgi:diguanylate cyclase (GGDEF)-like protein